MSSKIGNKAAAETRPLPSAGSQLAPSDPKPIQVVPLDSMRRDARALTGTKIEYRSEDDAVCVPGYPQPADDFPRDGFRVAERHEQAAAVREQFDGVPAGCRDRHLARAWIHRNLRWGEHPIAVPTTSDHRDRVSNRGHLENGQADAEPRRALS